MKAHVVVTRMSLVVALLVAASCGAIVPERSCHDAAQNANVAGTWVLSGKGTRESCANGDLDGGFELRSGTPLEVRQSPGPNGTDLLALDVPVTPAAGGTFGFSGVVDKGCVDFTLAETSTGDTLSFDCTGEADGAAVSGTFDGSGPSGCRSSGTFDLTVVLRDDCSPDPCQNGGLCTDGPYGFACTCPAGWAGATCADTDFCASHPCLNAGACSNGPSSFSCQCAPGWTGTTCADVDDCYPDPCRNGGHCIDGAGSYTCACPTGTTGATCESDIDECALGLANCAAGATCTNTFGSFTCACPSGQTGDGVTCKAKTSSSPKLPSCQAGGTPAWTALVLVLLAWSRLRRRRPRGDA